MGALAALGELLARARSPFLFCAVSVIYVAAHLRLNQVNQAGGEERAKEGGTYVRRRRAGDAARPKRSIGAPVELTPAAPGPHTSHGALALRSL